MVRKAAIRTKSWNRIKAGLKPEVLAEADRLFREELESMLLAELRKLAGMTQTELADRLGVNQSTISQLEHQDDVQVSTLRRIVEALGGELEITAKLPGGRITIAPFSSRAA